MEGTEGIVLQCPGVGGEISDLTHLSGIYQSGPLSQQDELFLVFFLDTPSYWRYG
jgi:hypothetical protein